MKKGLIACTIIMFLLIVFFVFEKQINIVVTNVVYKPKVSEELNEYFKGIGLIRLDSFYEQSLLFQNNSDLAFTRTRRVNTKGSDKETFRVGTKVYRLYGDVVSKSNDPNLIILGPMTLLDVSVDGNNWTTVVKSESPFCDFATTYKDTIYCFNNFISEMTVISGEGTIKKKPLKDTETFDILAAKKVGNVFNIVWRDRRAQWPNIYGFIPIPNSENPTVGPFLIMAGEINLDTLEFKQHLIKYNSYNWP